MPITVSFPAYEMTTALDGALAVKLNMHAAEAKELLQGARFDQAPVINVEDRLCGWVRTADLGRRGTVGRSLIPLERCAIQARDTPVKDAVQAIAASGLVFF